MISVNVQKHLEKLVYDVKIELTTIESSALTVH
jgi:hypothetical protein